ncbi:hypothetical protein T265_09956 [Opisthorchis viverrini]|uniref:Uncharacterized protein n=1 Tax=Opisthorchis viverrini TaxID=6198 RepID=A0A074Z3Y5_OPIVI|nr:hypothetical protein T265_09956 [Opisthorchis viverrini]KER21796.1 hypothetical protein T265_09956 [Opisthorchis viverrini]
MKHSDGKYPLGQWSVLHQAATCFSRYDIRTALLIRLLKIRRQPTTGFVLLGAHQSPLRSYGYWDLAHVTDSTYTRTTTRNLRRYSTSPTRNGNPRRVLSSATTSAKIGEDLRALSRNLSAQVSPLKPSSLRIDNHWPSELTAFSTSAKRLARTLVRVWTKWKGSEFADQKVRGSNPTSASRIPLSRLGQPGSTPALVPPSCSMAARQLNASHKYVSIF